MKLILTVITLHLCLCCMSQQKVKSKDRYALIATFAFMSGVSDGIRDATLFHNDAVLRKLNTNSSFWRADSYLNKYKSRDPNKGERFPGSTSVLVFTTDAPHLFKFTNNLFTAGAIAIQFNGQKHNWKYYVLKGIGFWAVNRVGFSIAYNQFTK